VRFGDKVNPFQSTNKISRSEISAPSAKDMFLHARANKLCRHLLTGRSILGFPSKEKIN
jgi:hypothetical protein